MRNVGRLIADNSIEAPSSTNLMQGALAGMANAVGDAPYTAYLPPQDQEEYLRDMDGQYAGVGMANFVKDAASGEFYFVPIANSPASDAGLKFGDRLVAIDGRNVDETSLFELVSNLRGKENSSVELTIRPQAHINTDERRAEGANDDEQKTQRNGTHDEEVVTKTLERRVIQQDVVLGDRRDEQGNWIYTLQSHPDVGYVAVEQFTSSVATLFAEALKKLESEQIEKVILDFRNNPGGSLIDAVEICNSLLASGSPIVETRNVKGASHKYYARYNTQRRFKIALLVNGASASAAEIVAAALQDAGIAVVVGERTYGKGTVQSVYEIPGKMGILHMTTASFWRPSGRPIHRKHDATSEDEWGVTPDQGYETKLTSAQRFYTNWTRRVRVSENNAKAANADAFALMTKETVALLDALENGAPIERAEAAFELGVEPESLQLSAKDGQTDQEGAQSKSEDATGNRKDDKRETFKPLGRAPYFDPQLDRALDYLNN